MKDYRALTVLIVEDSASDAGLIARHIENAGYDLRWEQVETAADLKAALERGRWDVVLCDHSMPGFSGTEALAMVGASGHDLPFIFVSGTMGEDIAVEAMKAGAHDYVVKGNLKRLVPAIERELREAAVRRERRRAEEALRASDERFRTLFELAPDAIYLIDLEGNFVDGNRAAERLVGLPREELIGRSFAAANLLSPEDLARALANLARNVQGEPTGPDEFVLCRLDGVRVPVEIRTFPIQILGRSLVLGVARDITERKRAEEQIRFQASLLDHARDAIMVRDLDHRVLYWNRGAVELFGWTAEEAAGRHATDLLRRDARELQAATGQVLQTGQWSGEVRLFTKDQREVVASSRWTLMRDAQGQPTSVLVIDSDITEQKTLETRFLRAQRLESIGQLAGGIAHDLNNILTPVIMLAPMLREAAEDTDLRELVNAVESSAKRGAEVIKQILTFSRGLQGEKAPVYTRHLFQEITGIIRETFPRTIQVQTDVPRDLWLAEGDTTQLHQVLMNLCVNARDAMPEGGLLTLAAENVQLDEATARQTPGLTSGRYVAWRISDTGGGIPPEHLERIFDPFFTTKDLGQGTGLGLSTVLGIVRNHGGWIDVTSEIGRGAQFRILLPAAVGDGQAMPEDGAVKVPRSEGDLILVVDDEAAVRQTFQRALEHHGYRVMTAPDGAEAMRLYERHHGEIRAVVTDMDMPPPNGTALIRSIRSVNRHARIIRMSGHPRKDGSDLGLSTFLQKPCTPRQLMDALHQALSRA